MKQAQLNSVFSENWLRLIFSYKSENCLNLDFQIKYNSDHNLDLELDLEFYFEFYLYLYLGLLLYLGHGLYHDPHLYECIFLDIDFGNAIDSNLEGYFDINLVFIIYFSYT